MIFPRAVLREGESTSMAKLLPRRTLVKYANALMVKLPVLAKNASRYPQKIAEVFSLLLVSVVQPLSAQRYNQDLQRQWKHPQHKVQLPHHSWKSHINKQGVLLQRHQTPIRKIQLKQPLLPPPPPLQQQQPDQSGPLLLQ